MSFVLIDDAKVRRVLPDSKYSGEIFSELLRQCGRLATKPLQAAKRCRKERKYVQMHRELKTAMDRLEVEDLLNRV